MGWCRRTVGGPASAPRRTSVSRRHPPVRRRRLASPASPGWRGLGARHCVAVGPCGGEFVIGPSGESCSCRDVAGFGWPTSAGSPRSGRRLSRRAEPGPVPICRATLRRSWSRLLGWLIWWSPSIGGRVAGKGSLRPGCGFTAKDIAWALTQVAEGGSCRATSRETIWHPAVPANSRSLGLLHQAFLAGSNGRSRD